MSKNDYVDYVVYDLLGHLDGITSRAMFGGYGLYQDGLIFAIIDDDELYFKVDSSNQPDFEQHGSSPFTYTSKGKTMSMSYWKVPAEVMEDREMMTDWVERSVTISRNSKRKKKKK